jgi:hypothetical protein
MRRACSDHENWLAQRKRVWKAGALSGAPRRFREHIGFVVPGVICS